MTSDTRPLTEDELARPLTAEEASFERELLVKLLHDRHHDQDCERTAVAILDRGFRFMGKRAALRATPVADTAGIDAAWEEAEAALPQRPDGGGVWDSSGGVGLELARLTKGAYVALWGDKQAHGDSPAAALLALAAALRAVPA